MGLLLALLFLIVVACSPSALALGGPELQLAEARSFLRQYDVQGSAACHALVNAQWDLATNVTPQAAEIAASEQQRYDKFMQAAWRRAEAAIPWRQLSSEQPHLFRQFMRLAAKARDTAGLTDELQTEMQRVMAELRDIHSRTAVCPAPGTEHALGPNPSARSSSPNRCTLRLEPELAGIMETSRDPAILSFAWRSWRDAVGPPSRSRYVRLVQLANMAARRNGFRDAGEQWRAEFEQDQSPGSGPGVAEAAAAAWHKIEPLYRQLHAFVRRRLAVRYGEALVRPRGPIPAHLLGNMWAQSWTSLEELVMPYPDNSLPDISEEMRRQDYTAMGVLQVAEQWFTSLGLPALPADFWRRSLLQRPADRPVLCGASAWDFCDGRDFRLKMCTTPTLPDLVSAHHELSHVQYYMHYAAQPVLFRDGANPAFHEAVGEMVGLAVSNPVHLQRLGLFPGNNSNNEEMQINFLMRVALDKIAFLPFSYLVDLWRWRVFSGEWRAPELNARWWQLRLSLQGVSPPVRRSEMDFDPAAKRHVATHRPYIGYMVSGLLQFEILRALCKAAGHRGPLHQCDLQNSREAGRLLSKMMSAGASRPWPEVLALITENSSGRLMDPDALLEYFQPLERWLTAHNGADGLEGWDTSGFEIEFFSPLTTYSAADRLHWRWLGLATLFPALLLILTFRP